MYFAANCVFTSVVGAISGSLVYENIKMLFFKTEGGFAVKWAESFEAAATNFGVAENQVFNFGTALVPFIVSFFCILGAILAAKMPKDYTPKLVAEEFKKHDPSLDISVIESDPSYEVKEEKGEIIFVQLGLWALSGSLFGFIWSAFIIGSAKVAKRGMNILLYIAACFVPFAQIPVVMAMRKAILERAKNDGVEMKINLPLLIALSVCFPIMPVNIITLSILQHKINKLIENEQVAKTDAKNCATVA